MGFYSSEYRVQNTEFRILIVTWCSGFLTLRYPGMDILFWSGGKDSYLALEFYRRDHKPADALRLLTTYEQSSETVPHQNIPVSEIIKQAENLDLEIILVPLPKDCPNDLYVEQVKKALNQEPDPVIHLIFGDWKLEDIRSWRESVFGEMGYKCLFPIWEKSLHDLLPVILLKPVKVEISAVREEFQSYLRVGEEYSQKLVRQLPPEIDPMGENGEFHTRVIFHKLDEEVI